MFAAGFSRKVGGCRLLNRLLKALVITLGLIGPAMAQERILISSDWGKLTAELVHRGDRILVHCGLGLNRSALIVALVLRYLGLDANAAVQRCTERRPGALFNEVFKEYLLSGLVNPVPQAGPSSG